MGDKGLNQDILENEIFPGEKTFILRPMTHVIKAAKNSVLRSIEESALHQCLFSKI